MDVNVLADLFEVLVVFHQEQTARPRVEDVRLQERAERKADLRHGEVRQCDGDSVHHPGERAAHLDGLVPEFDRLLE